ncbi:VOC family protein [Streptomyces sp. NPDC085900]|uniref:VOC family protein n=1 Tax=Streptomyces sp. NPDC085900 TaxID=3365737 RepID=UPI0037D113B6
MKVRQLSMPVHFEAVDPEKMIRFWGSVPGFGAYSVGEAESPAVLPVVTVLVGTVAEQVQTLIAKGASLVELHEPLEALMTDPEGNRFRVELDPDQEA